MMESIQTHIDAVAYYSFSLQHNHQQRKQIEIKEIKIAAYKVFVENGFG